MILILIFIERISTVGPGFCRPAGCDITDSSCLIKGHFKDESSYEECSTICLGEISCIGFAISESDYTAAPSRCYVHGNIWQQNAPLGWLEFPKQYLDVYTSSTTSGVMCYRVGNAIKNIISFYELLINDHLIFM